MKLDFSLQVQQVQKLLMTPQLKQAIKILQMPSLELQEYIQQKVEENPVLEISEERESNEYSDYLDKKNFDKNKETKIKDTIDWQEYFNERHYEEVSFGKEVVERDSFETYTKKEITFLEYFEQQLRMLKLCKREEKIAEYIIGSLDENGYLQSPLEEIALSLGVKESTVERVLKIVQSLEPGIGARSLKECLLLQVMYRKDAPPNTSCVIENYLELVGEMKLPKLAEILNLSLVQVQEIVDYIKKLNPRPGLAFVSSIDNRYIQPDVLVLEYGEEYMVIINDNIIPRLRINNYYKNLLNNGNSEEQEYIKDNLNSAHSLLKSIEQRKKTLQQVMEFIVNYQKEFFKHGIKYLKPLKLKDVADSLNIHESTVSRATNGKYADTPRGIFELKYFFSGSLESDCGEELSTIGIKKRIMEMIEKEDKNKPLSDQQIADILQKEGVNISRRTVAKYRDEANIPSSAKRKRYK